MAEGVHVLVAPGTLNTTLAPTALDAGQARDLVNCDTGRGRFELDLRHRLFCESPTVNDPGESTTEIIEFGGVGTQEMRPLSNVLWTSPDKAKAGDDEASCVMDNSDLTYWLRVGSMIPSTVVPLDSTIVSLKALVRHRATGTFRPKLDALDVLVGGVLKQSLPLSAVVPEALGTETITLDVSAMGVTPEQINLGLVSLRASYRTNDTPIQYAGGNFRFQGNTVTNRTYGGFPADATDAFVVDQTQSIAFGASYDGPANSGQTVKFTSTANFTIKWIGAGQAPASVLFRRYRVFSAGNQSVDATPNNKGTLDLGNGEVYTGKGVGMVLDEYITLPIGNAGATVSVAQSAESFCAPITGPNQTNKCYTAENYLLAPWDGQALPNTTLYVREILLQVTFQTAGGGDVLGVPSGIGYAIYQGNEEIPVVYSPGAFVAPGSKVPTAYGPGFGLNLAPRPLENGRWRIWSFDGKVFYTEPEGGLWYRSIGGGILQPLYKDVESPGSSGDASFVADASFLDFARFDPSVDTVVWSNGANTGSNTGFTSAGLLTVSTRQSYANAVVTLGTPISAQGADAIGVVLTDKAGTTDGYRSAQAMNYVILTNSANVASASIPIKPVGRLDAKGGSYAAWGDLSGVPESIKNDVKKIELRIGTKPGIGSTDFRVETFAFGGIRYRDTDWPGATVANTAGTEYAYNVSEGATNGPARLLNVTPAGVLGKKIATGSSFMGAVVTVTVPQGDAPFTPAAQINLYRKIGSTYRRVATGPNTDRLVFIDRLQDAQIAADTATYPVIALSFDQPTGSFSGQVEGIVCGCAWKGSNIYGGQDGKLYGSRTGFFDDVLWDNVVRTNDVGSEDLSPPRTLVLADDLTSPVLCLVPGESLYGLTAREVYAMIPGETFATASFPRKCDGARGVVGVRAADLYGDACLYGAADGLWFVRKATFDNNQPDELTEMTRDNRGAWAWLLGSTPEAVVVRVHLGEIWCFNGVRSLHLTRQGRTIKGEWTDGRGVVDATSDPTRGLILQLSDGSLAVVGPYPSDGGTDLGGTDGVVPTWVYRTGIRLIPHSAGRAVVFAEIGEDGEARLDVETDREDSPASVSLSDSGTRLASLAIDRATGGGELVAFTLAGRAQDRVLSVDVELTPRESARQLDKTINS